MLVHYYPHNHDAAVIDSNTNLQHFGHLAGNEKC